jgi:hypothetical protein
MNYITLHGISNVKMRIGSELKWLRDGHLAIFGFGSVETLS